MGRGLRTAIAVEAVVLVVAFAFSIAYFVMGWYRASHAPTVVLIVLWVLVAAALLFVFWARTLKREEMVRRFYLNKDWIYNHEIGYAPVAKIVPDGDAYELVTFAAESLAQMSYGFEVADPPENFKPDYLVSSSSFHFHKIEAEEGEDADGVVIDTWAGMLQRISHDGNGNDPEEIGTFENAAELARLLEQVEALV